MKKLLYTLFFLLLILQTRISAQNAEVHGRIFDASNNEAVAFANVIVDGTNTGSTSDLEGNFIITGLKPGFIKLKVSFVGYKTQLSSDVLVSNNNIPFIEIPLEPLSTQLEEVVIKVSPFEKTTESPLSMQSIGIKQIESNPGSNRDISRVIQSFPGVGSTPAFRNDVIIRGGGPSENRFFLDGIEIPVLNHFSTQGASGGPVGIINADFIENVDFYSGSFPANKYNALSGMLDFRQKEGSRDKTNLQFTLGASETAITLDGPIGKKTSYIFSLRRSYLQLLFTALQLPFLPTYNDYQFKIKSNINKNNQITIISLGSLDNLALNTGIKDPDASQEYILSQIPVNNQWSYTFGINYKNFFKNGFHTLVASRNMLNNSFYKYPDNDESRGKIFDYLSTEAENKLRYELSLRKNEFKYVITANLEYADYYNKTYQQLYLNDSLIDFNYESSLNLIKYGASAQLSRKVLNNNLLISAGIRFDGNNFNSQTANLLNQFSPRISFSYSLSDDYKLNFGAGRYFQQPAYTTLGFRDNNGALVNKDAARYIGANHINLGLEHYFNEKILLSVEGFYKDYFQYPIDIITGASLANQGAEYSSVAGATIAQFNGKGKAYGFEILSRINIKSFNFLGSYTFVRSEFNDINGNYIPSSWDSRHLLTLTGTKEFGKNWRMGFKWRFVGGLPYTPYDLETSAKVEAWDARGQAYFDYSQLNAERNPSFHQLDIRVDKNFFFNKWAFMVYLDIQNLYNFKSKGQDYVVREKNDDGSYKTTAGGTEYVLKSVENLSGTVLPTIGIMIKL